MTPCTFCGQVHDTSACDGTPTWNPYHYESTATFTSVETLGQMWVKPDIAPGGNPDDPSPGCVAVKSTAGWLILVNAERHTGITPFQNWSKVVHTPVKPEDLPTEST